MSASWPGNMRGPRVKTPQLLLLLLLLLLTTLTRTVLCQDDEAVAETVAPIEVEETELTDDLSTQTPSSIDETTDDGETDQSSGSTPDLLPESPAVTTPTATPLDVDGDQLNPTIILIPVVLVVVIIALIVCCIVINRRCNKKAGNQDLTEDPYLDGPSTEKVPMPMFEEDVPSVLELEMEELDQWMKKDG